MFLPIIFSQNRLRGSGHGIAAARMDAKLNVAGWISEQMGGIRLAFFAPVFLSGNSLLVKMVRHYIFLIYV